MLLQSTGIEQRYGMPHTPCYRSAGYRAGYRWSVTRSAPGDCLRRNPYRLLLRVANLRVVHGPVGSLLSRGGLRWLRGKLGTAGMVRGRDREEHGDFL